MTTTSWICAMLVFPHCGMKTFICFDVSDKSRHPFKSNRMHSLSVPLYYGSDQFEPDISRIHNEKNAVE